MLEVGTWTGLPETSPGLTLGIPILQAVEHHCTVKSGLVASGNIVILVGNIEQLLPYGPPLLFGQSRKFLYNFRRAHAGKLPASLRNARIFLLYRIHESVLFKSRPQVNTRAFMHRASASYL